MRTYGRVVDPNTGAYVRDPSTGCIWWTVETDANGSNDYVWITTLCQVLAGNLQESPFYGNYGLPAKQAIIQQILPDYNVALTQQQFSQYFASLTITRGVKGTKPVYNVKITTNAGVPVAIAVPQ